MGAFLLLPVAHAQSFHINTDETLVKPFVLPDVLTAPSGIRAVDTATWYASVRPVLLDIFGSEMYGKMPTGKVRVHYHIRSITANTLHGTAIRKEIVIVFNSHGIRREADILMYLPMKADKPVPVFLGLNFCGNQCIWPDSGITPARTWLAGRYRTVNNRATEASRGMQEYRWPIDTLISHGFGLVTVYCGDFFPDHPDGYSESILPLFRFGSPADSPGAITAWAWGLSRVLDYLETDRDVDARKVIVIGHSRLGKAALWAAANDTRFAMAVSNNSGCCGAKISRRNYGESFMKIISVFPYWFCPRFVQYAGKEDAFPVDQHQLLALIAPRPVYVASASADDNADPRGEFLAAAAVLPVYRLFNRPVAKMDSFPSPSTFIHSTVSYHLREGGHDILLWDWQHFIKFAGSHLK